MAVLLDHVDFLGFSLTPYDLEGTIQHVQQILASPTCIHQVVGINLDQLLKMKQEPDFAHMVMEADIRTADGIAIVLIARLLGISLPERVPAIDVMLGLLPFAAQQGYRLFLLGARPGVAEQAAVRLEEKHPGLQIAGTYHGYYGPDEAQAIVAQINESRADLLLLGMSSPRKEEFVFHHKQALRPCVSIAVGSAFDIEAGVQRRAPAWMQRIGTEWLWRMIQEPRRIGGRMLEARKLIPYLLHDLRRTRHVN